MVNLLVVALLLASSLSVEGYGVDINDFQFLCMKQDGSYFRLSGVLVTVSEKGGDDILSARADDNGRLTASRSYGQNVEITLMIPCIIYTVCPAIANECQFTNPRHHPQLSQFSFFTIPYEEYEDAFKNGGVYALITPRNYIVTTSRSKLPTAKMTVAQFCEPPHGRSQLRYCNFKALKKRSNNTDNGTATADFNESHPARLAKGDF